MQKNLLILFWVYYKKRKGENMIGNSFDFRGVNITALGHSSFKIKSKGLVLYIDPYDINDYEKANFVLITHGHYDHCSIKDIKSLVKKDTTIIAPPDCSSQISKLNNENIQVELVEPYKSLSFDKYNLKIGTIPAYNINKEFHKKINNWVGYIVEINGVRIYHAGDTDFIPEMRGLKNIDIALLPVGGTYTMNSEEAAIAAKTIKPKIAVPMHYGKIVGTKYDAVNFKKLTSNCCEAKILI